MRKKSIAVIDDHHIVRKGLIASVNNLAEYEVTLEASNGKEFFTLLKTQPNPELAIIDLHMPIMNGFDTILELKNRYPDIKSLALTVDTTKDALVKAIRNGASGFIRKNARPALFKAAIDTIFLTGYFLNEDIHSTYQTNPTLQTSDEIQQEELLQQMTKRELEFLEYVCDEREMTYEEIAEEMSITKRTVDYYRKELFEKFHIKSKAGLVLFALKNKLVKI